MTTCKLVKLFGTFFDLVTTRSIWGRRTRLGQVTISDTCGCVLVEVLHSYLLYLRFNAAATIY